MHSKGFVAFLESVHPRTLKNEWKCSTFREMTHAKQVSSGCEIS